MGHFSRASRIASALESQLNLTVGIYVVVPRGENGTNYFGGAKLLSPLLPLRREIFNDGGAIDLFVVDVPPYRVSDNLKDCLVAARAAGATIVSVDNLDLRCHVDLVFLPTFRQPNSKTNTVQQALLVYGWDCFLLDENTEPIHWQPGQRVLALTGGSDATSLGRHWPALLATSLPGTTELNWVTGPFAQAPVFPKTPRIRMTQHVAPNGLQHLMSTTNYAITVYGVSFFELLQHGVPTVVFSPYGEKDRAELNEIQCNRLAIVAEDEVDAIEKLVGLMADHSMAAELASRGAERLKYPGVNRLCEEIRLLQKKRREASS